MEQGPMGALAIPVLGTGTGVAERLRTAPPDAGRVHSTFDRALNLDWHDGRLLALQGPGPLLAPFAASLAWLPRFRALRPGQHVWRRGAAIALDGLLLDSRSAVTVDTVMPAAAAGPHPALSALSAPSSAASGLSSANWRRARTRLVEGVSRRDPAAFVEGALGLVGLGEGLTPAGDDCLVGTLAVLHRFTPSWLRAHPDIAAIVERTAAGATTAIAHEFIAHALAGRFAGSLIDLLIAESAEAVTGAVTQLLRSGATSGADTVCGVHLALTALRARTW